MRFVLLSQHGSSCHLPWTRKISYSQAGGWRLTAETPPPPTATPGFTAQLPANPFFWVFGSRCPNPRTSCQHVSPLTVKEQLHLLEDPSSPLLVRMIIVFYS